MGLSVEFGELDLRGGGGIGDRNVELQAEIVATEIVDVPTRSRPSSALGIIGGDPEPIIVVGFVHRSIRN